MALQLMFLLASPLSDAPHHCLDYNSLCPSQKRAADEVLIHSDGKHGHSSSRRDGGPGRSPPLRHCFIPPAADSGTTSNGGGLGWNVEAQG